MALITNSWAVFAAVVELSVVSAATFVIVLSIAVVSSSLSSPKLAYMFWFIAVYPI
jgi:hypothetical protein